MKVRVMNEKDHNIVLNMVHQFYHTDAVSHIVSEDIIENCFQEALKVFSNFQGLILENDNEIVGYAYLTMFFTTEIGGFTQMIEQLFILEKERGKGFATQFLKWLDKEYSHVSRWRLEVNNHNSKAIALYKRLGFSFIDYGQMMKDRNNK